MLPAPGLSRQAQASQGPQSPSRACAIQSCVDGSTFRRREFMARLGTTSVPF